MIPTNNSSLYEYVDVSDPTVIGATFFDNLFDPWPIKLLLEESKIYFQYAPHVAGLFFIYSVLNCVSFFRKGEQLQKEIKDAKRVLLVIAHPDDECMFFGPILTHLGGVTDVYLVCLSDGGYEGLGSTRMKELWMSCDKLGLTVGNIRLYRHRLLPDNPKCAWSPLLVGHIIMQFVETLSVDTVITFDAYGVSGHSNHSAIYRAIMHLRGKRAIPEYCKIYFLESVGIFRKYSMFIDLLLSYYTSRYIYVCSIRRRDMILEAMTQHTSQLLWYRRLYLIFSRYSYINTFRAIS